MPARMPTTTCAMTLPCLLLPVGVASAMRVLRGCTVFAPSEGRRAPPSHRQEFGRRGWRCACIAPSGSRVSGTSEQGVRAAGRSPGTPRSGGARSGRGLYHRWTGARIRIGFSSGPFTAWSGVSVRRFLTRVGPWRMLAAKVHDGGGKPARVLRHSRSEPKVFEHGWNRLPRRLRLAGIGDRIACSELGPGAPVHVQSDRDRPDRARSVEAAGEDFRRVLADLYEPSRA